MSSSLLVVDYRMLWWPFGPGQRSPSREPLAGEPRRTMSSSLLVLDYHMLWWPSGPGQRSPWKGPLASEPRRTMSSSLLVVDYHMLCWPLIAGPTDTRGKSSWQGSPDPQYLVLSSSSTTTCCGGSSRVSQQAPGKELLACEPRPTMSSSLLVLGYYMLW